MAYPRRLIEVDLPIRRISTHARREKAIRHGHISTLHIWWARRPLAACRAVILAGLWPDPADDNCPAGFRTAARDAMAQWATRNAEKASSESYPRLNRITKTPLLLDDPIEVRRTLLDFIADFAIWENSVDSAYLETTRRLVRVAHESLGGAAGPRPMVVDPFAGGGSIPLEALRVGADVVATDLNPIPVLLNKVTVEYIPKHGERLAAELRKQSEWIRREAEKELGHLFPTPVKGATPIAFLWARTILSEAPGEGSLPVEVPLVRSMWLAKGGSRGAALRWVRDDKGSVVCRTVERTFADGRTLRVRQPQLEVFEPQKAADVPPGTSTGGAATCPVTGFTTAVESVRRQLMPRSGGAADSRLIAVVETRDDQSGRLYRTPLPADWAGELSAQSELKRRMAGRPNFAPSGEINHLRGFFNIVLYGMKTWGSLFTQRQLLVLDTVGRLVAAASKNVPPDLAEAVESCLALVLGRIADGNSSLARWQNAGQKISNTFGRQALPMVWDYAEANPFCSATRSLESMFEWIIEVVEREGRPGGSGSAQQADAAAHFLPDDSAALLCTDPPYYSAVPYADLSDFFYSWLSRALRHRHPQLFSAPLTPKDEECVQLSHRAAMYRQKDQAWYESKMTRVAGECRRITQPSGLGIWVFASKETAAWEAMLSALVTGGWTITASWPIDTEMASRLRAQDSATLASSIHIACRPRESPDGALLTDTVGDWRDVLNELPRRIHQWMPRLAAEGVVGADAIFACLGPALEVFSRYARVEKASGEEVPLREYLEHVWAAIAKEALSVIFSGAETTGFEEDARLTAMWLWTLSTGASAGAVDDGADLEADDDDAPGAKAKPGGFSLQYDAARKIAQGLGAHLEDLTTVVEVRGETARLLPVSDRTRVLFGKGESEAPARPRKRVQQMKLGFAEELEEAEQAAGWGQKGAPEAGRTVLDRVHQSMILFAAGRGEALRRFLVDEETGRDARFWRLAQALAALYPTGADERRWVEGVLARKKSLGF